MNLFDWFGSKSKKTPIKLGNKEFLLIGSFNSGWAIATQEQFDNFEDSYAHLLPDGRIMRYGKQIGSKEDIVVIEKPLDSV